MSISSNLISLPIKMERPIGFLKGNNISKASQSKIRKAYDIKRVSKNNPNPVIDVAVSLGFEATGNNRLRKAFAYLAEDYNKQVEEIKLNANKLKQEVKKMKIKIKKNLKIRQKIAKEALKRKLKRLVSSKRNIQVSTDLVFKGWFKPKDIEKFEKQNPSLDSETLANLNEAELTALLGKPFEEEIVISDTIKNTNDEKLKFINKAYQSAGNPSPFIVHHSKLQNVSFNQTPSKRVYVDNIRVKRNGVLKLGGDMYDCPPEWCKNRDMCFPDYIQYVFRNPKKTKGRIKKITDEKIQELSLLDYEGNIDDNLDKNPNQNGYSVEHMMNYAYQVKASIYILIDGEVVKQHKHPNTSDAVALVFEIKNSHLYPIVQDKYIRAIRCKKTSHLHTNTFQEYKKEDEEEQEEKKYDNVIDIGGGGISNIINNIVEIGEQPTHYSLTLVNGKALPFKMGNNLYLTQRKDDVVMNYCNKNNIQYIGQTATYFAKQYLNDFIKKHYSYPAKDVEEVLSMDNVKFRTHLGLVRNNKNSILFKEGKINDDCICRDINKCYRYSMENPLEGWATIPYNHFVKYTDKYMGFGLYFLETNDTTLLTGNNWYSSAMVLKCNKENIDYKIKAFIKCNESPKDIFINLINQIESEFDDIKLIKNIINSIYGWCAKTESTYQRLCIDTDVNVVFNDYAKWEALKNQTPYIRKFNPIADEKNTYYTYGNKDEIKEKVNNLPMAIQIQDQANIQLYDMCKKTGGEVLYRKTDCAVIYKPKNELILSKEVGGYSREVFPVKLKFETPKFKRDVKLPKRKYWNEHTFPTSDSYEEIINIILDNGGGMIDAEAGVGKTFVAKELIKVCDERGLKYKALAFTNKATTHLNGMTIDSYFRKNKNGKLDRRWLWEISKDIDVIIVDEISMVSGENWKILQEFKEQTDCIFMLLGHSWQLPPVENNQINWFNHSCVKYLSNYNKIIIEGLSTKSRYDRKMRDFVRDVYLNDEWTDETKQIMNNVKKVNVNDMINGNNIAYTNKTRREINKKVQNELIKNNESIYIEYNGNNDQYPQNAYIFNGAKLLLHHTSKDKIFKKNETAIVKTIKEASFIIEKNEIEYEFMYENFHKEFLLGYATTIHKSQGDTLKDIVNIFDTKLMNEWLKDKRCIYTALTRATAIDKINICEM